MKGKIEVKKKIILELEPEEAYWLMGICQVESCSDQDYDIKMKDKFFTILEDLKESYG